MRRVSQRFYRSKRDTTTRATASRRVHAFPARIAHNLSLNQPRSRREPQSPVPEPKSRVTTPRFPRGDRERRANVIRVYRVMRFPTRLASMMMTIQRTSPLSKTRASPISFLPISSVLVHEDIQRLIKYVIFNRFLLNRFDFAFGKLLKSSDYYE